MFDKGNRILKVSILKKIINNGKKQLSHIGLHKTMLRACLCLVFVSIFPLFSQNIHFTESGLCLSIYCCCFPVLNGVSMYSGLSRHTDRMWRVYAYWRQGYQNVVQHRTNAKDHCCFLSYSCMQLSLYSRPTFFLKIKNYFKIFFFPI